MDKSTDDQKRMNPEPEAKDLGNPLEVWENGTSAPALPATSTIEAETGMRGRVADAGDLASGNPTPYTLDVQVDALSKIVTNPSKS